MNCSSRKSTLERLQIKSDSSAIKTCPKHGDYEFSILQFSNTVHETPCPECLEEHRKEREAKEREEMRRAKIDRYISRVNAPKRFKSCTVDGFQTENHEGKIHAKKVAQEFITKFKKCREKGTCLIFCGPPGTGKTHIACAIGLELARNMISARYTTEYRMLHEIKQTWGDYGGDENQVMESFTSPSLLIIDEVGVSFGSDKDKILLYEIINARYERMLPMILIANLTEDELAEHVGGRAYDRLKEEGFTVAFNWESYRQRKEK